MLQVAPLASVRFYKTTKYDMMRMAIQEPRDLLIRSGKVGQPWSTFRPSPLTVNRLRRLKYPASVPGEATLLRDDDLL